MRIRGKGWGFGSFKIQRAINPIPVNALGVGEGQVELNSTLLSETQPLLGKEADVT